MTQTLPALLRRVMIPVTKGPVPAVTKKRKTLHLGEQAFTPYPVLDPRYAPLLDDVFFRALGLKEQKLKINPTLEGAQEVFFLVKNGKQEYKKSPNVLPATHPHLSPAPPWLEKLNESPGQCYIYWMVDSVVAQEDDMLVASGLHGACWSYEPIYNSVAEPWKHTGIVILFEVTTSSHRGEQKLHFRANWFLNNAGDPRLPLEFARWDTLIYEARRGWLSTCTAYDPSKEGWRKKLSEQLKFFERDADTLSNWRDAVHLLPKDQAYSFLREFTRETTMWGRKLFQTRKPPWLSFQKRISFLPLSACLKELARSDAAWRLLAVCKVHNINSHEQLDWELFNSDISKTDKMRVLELEWLPALVYSAWKSAENHEAAG